MTGRGFSFVFTVATGHPWAPMDSWKGEDPHPNRADFPTHQAYEQAWYLWRARQRDNRLNDEELAAQWEVTESFLRARLRQDGGHAQ